MLIVAGALIILVVISVNTFWGPFLGRGPALKDRPKVSICVPLRNESANVDGLIQSLRSLTYPDLEILLLDDQSTDDTAGKIKKSIQHLDHFHLIAGKDRPQGRWVGKNWACWQMARVSTGDVLVFTDADNRHAPDSIEKSLGWMQKYNLKLLSAFPQTQNVSWWEKMVVPTVESMVYLLLPMWSVFAVKSKSLVAANGQWMVFDREKYFTSGGHAAVKSDIVEDMAMMKLIKENGCKVMTLAGTGMIYTRMYSSFREIWHGFSKNLYGIAGYSLIGFLVMWTFLIGAQTIPLLFLIRGTNFEAGLFGTIIILLSRLMLWIKFKHPFWTTVFFYPLSLVITALIGLNSIWQYYFGNYQWKDAAIPNLSRIPQEDNLESHR
jgi:cellulose synthase/poly-beta-1,6-N-acetylglucosamine synthase-like glycosyltransferase